MKTIYCPDDLVNSVECPVCKKRQKVNINPELGDWAVCEQECDCGHRFEARLEEFGDGDAWFEVDKDEVYNVKTGKKVLIK